MDRYMELVEEIDNDDYWLIKCVGKVEMIERMIMELENEKNILLEKLTK